MIPQLLMIAFFVLMFTSAVARHGKRASDGSIVNGIPVAVLFAVQAVILWWGGFWS